MSGPKAALGGPIALVEDGDEILVDLNTNEINCTPLNDPAVAAARKAAWNKAVADNGGFHSKPARRRKPIVAARAGTWPFRQCAVRGCTRTGRSGCVTRVRRSIRGSGPKTGSRT